MLDRFEEIFKIILRKNKELNMTVQEVLHLYQLLKKRQKWIVKTACIQCIS